MTSTQLSLLFFVLCGISLHKALGQMSGFNSSSNTNSGAHGTENLTNGGSQSEVEVSNDEDALSYLGEVQSVEEFMHLLRKPDGAEFTDEDREMVENAVLPQNNSDGKNVISTIPVIPGRLAIPDNCSPRNVTVRITMEEETSSDTAFFPRCTKIERCGGCCSSPNLECVPRYIERIGLKVLKGRVPYPGASHLEYTGFASVILDRHMTCRVNCKLSQEGCGPLKLFDRRRCSCKCRDRLHCPPPTVWDHENCQCKCSRVTQCCENSVSCGMTWNPTLCECRLSNEGRVVIHAQNDMPTFTTTTTTTTTAPTTPTIDPCAGRRCRRRFVLVRRGNTCRCSYQG